MKGVARITNRTVHHLLLWLLSSWKRSHRHYISPTPRRKHAYFSLHPSSSLKGGQLKKGGGGGGGSFRCYCGTGRRRGTATHTTPPKSPPSFCCSSNTLTERKKKKTPEKGDDDFAASQRESAPPTCCGEATRLLFVFVGLTSVEVSVMNYRPFFVVVVVVAV
jgi:hypothetical protein